jgi:2-C-methyl-D-erythritol 2,4-cyclodiphosphate synthase
VLITDEPKIAPYKQAIRKRLSELLGLAEENISLKGKRREGFCREEGIACLCVVLLSYEG